MAQKRRRNILKEVKGYRFSRSTKKKAAIEAIHHAHLHAFAHRKDRKADFRRLWTTRINAGVRAMGMKYSLFIKALHDKNILVDRKVLATFAKDRPETFSRIVTQVK